MVVRSPSDIGFAPVRCENRTPRVVGWRFANHNRTCDLVSGCIDDLERSVLQAGIELGPVGTYRYSIGEDGKSHRVGYLLGSRVNDPEVVALKFGHVQGASIWCDSYLVEKDITSDIDRGSNR